MTPQKNGHVAGGCKNNTTEKVKNFVHRSHTTAWLVGYLAKALGVHFHDTTLVFCVHVDLGRRRKATGHGNQDKRDYQTMLENIVCIRFPTDTGRWLSFFLVSVALNRLRVRVRERPFSFYRLVDRDRIDSVQCAADGRDRALCAYHGHVPPEKT